MSEEVKKSYRDDLVQQIKDAGQELIDTAEQMVRKDVRGISGFYIHIEFPQGECVGIPEITYSTETLCKNTYHRLLNEELNNGND